MSPVDSAFEAPTAAAERERARHDAQDYRYRSGSEIAEKEWRRLPGFAAVGAEEWAQAKWQRRNTVRSVEALRHVFGSRLDERLAAEITADQGGSATMALAVPPHVLNCMDEDDLWHDPLRRYMLPAASERQPGFSSHPVAHRDSLHETDMSPVPGLIHRYPTKALLETTASCPQYCGHCTRMDLVGPSLPALTKARLDGRRTERLDDAIAYLEATPWVRDVVVSGGDIANVPMPVLEEIVERLTALPNIRDIRLATKALISLPHHFLEPEVLRGFERMVETSRRRDVRLAVHTHVNHRSALTDRVAAAVKALREAGVRDIRNQGVILAGVNDSSEAILDLCFGLLDEVDVSPYYFYMCDLIPASEHWRIPLWQAQEISIAIQGYLPGFDTPRLVCDVPGAGKRLVTQEDDYDRTRGISRWAKAYLNPLEDPEERGRLHCYYDPVHTLPPEGVEFWRQWAREGAAVPG